MGESGGDLSGMEWIEFGHIEGLEWIGVVAYAAMTLVFFVMLFSAQGDMTVDTKEGTNSNVQAESVYIDELLAKARRSFVVHDDGDDSNDSVYNSTKVLNAFRTAVNDRGVQVNCLFNDRADIGIVALAREYPEKVRIWYVPGGRRNAGNVHYKVVDEGRVVHVSTHEHGDCEREFVLHKSRWWATPASRRRLSSAYESHFQGWLDLGAEEFKARRPEALAG